MSRRVAIIPARFHSTRFPGKVLALVAGRPMVVQVAERVRTARIFDEVCVAADDERVAEAVRSSGIDVVMTRCDHATGTERVAEAASRYAPDAIIFNVQADEPLLPPALLRELMDFLVARPHAGMATAAHRSYDPVAFTNRNVVKVLLRTDGQALYFSRGPVPGGQGVPEGGFLRHVGVYAFRRDTLSRFVLLPPSSLERCEGLEQLRALENGIDIHVLVTPHESVGVDTPEDLKDVASRLPQFLKSSTGNSGTRRGDGE